MAAPDPNTDWMLISRLAKGDESALSEMVAHWEGRVLSFAYRILSSRAVPDARSDAEEVVSEVFWKVYQSRQTVQPVGSFSSWLFRITYNLCADHLRKRNRQIQSVSFDDLKAQRENPSLDPAAPVSHRPDHAMMEQELTAQLEQALAQLPENQRAALVLCKMEGLSYQEIASVLDCSVSSVESLLFRARKSVQKHLGSYLETD